MHSKVKYSKYISIDSQMEIKKIIFLQEYKNDYKNKLNIFSEKYKNIPKFDNSDKINNYASIYVHDFDIKQINNKEKTPKKCIFNSLSEYNLNPFLSYAKNNDINQKKIIDLRNIKDTEEPSFLFLNNIFTP